MIYEGGTEPKDGTKFLALIEFEEPNMGQVRRNIPLKRYTDIAIAYYKHNNLQTGHLGNAIRVVSWRYIDDELMEGVSNE